MDWKIFATTFLTVFIAELGDKTQFITLGISASNSSKWAIFAGSALALTTASAIGVIAGSFIGEHISKKILLIISGLIFILFGFYTLWQGLK
jgi:putative Ca2+/H+ antiporter (TMEM165/GDT1 family)